jgi:hypothetical protein
MERSFCLQAQHPGPLSASGARPPIRPIRDGAWLRRLGALGWSAMSTQSERANPGVRLTLLDREAEIGKRLISGAQAIGIFAVPIADPR